MRQSKKRKKVERKLQIVRMIVYTAISFTIFQYIGVFALAELKGIYVKTGPRTNAFYPKTYVNVELKENDDDNHLYVLDDTGNAYVSGGTADQKKQFYVSNPGTNKKDVLVRAKIVAMIYSEDGTAVGETDTASETKKWYHNSNDDYYYYTSVLEKTSPSATEPNKTNNLFDNVQLTNISKIPEGGWVEFNVIVDTVEVDLKADEPYKKAKTAWGESVINSLTALPSGTN